MTDWEKKHEEQSKKLDAELDALQAAKSKEELDKRFLKNFSCINFIDDKAQHEFDLAKRYHERAEKAEPNAHSCRTRETFRNYEETKCPCGFAFAIDSSD